MAKRNNTPSLDQETLNREAREVALAAYQIDAEEIVHRHVGEAFDGSCRLPSAAELTIGDVLAAFVAALRRELDRVSSAIEPEQGSLN